MNYVQAPMGAYSGQYGTTCKSVLECVCWEHYFSYLQGKYFEIQFSRAGLPDGGKISNFLLEKVSLGMCSVAGAECSQYLALNRTDCVLFVTMLLYSALYRRITPA